MRAVPGDRLVAGGGAGGQPAAFGPAAGARLVIINRDPTGLDEIGRPGASRLDRRASGGDRSVVEDRVTVRDVIRLTRGCLAVQGSGFRVQHLQATSEAKS